MERDYIKDVKQRDFHTPKTTTREAYTRHLDIDGDSSSLDSDKEDIEEKKNFLDATLNMIRTLPEE